MSVQNNAKRKEPATEEVETSAEELLEARGITMSMEQLFELMVEQVRQLPELRRQSSSGMPTDKVRERLRDTGLTFEPYEGDEDPVAASVARYSELLASSLSTKAAAARLDVGASRVRQLLNATSPGLYGFKDANDSWKIPRFQFGQDGLIRGMKEVLRVLNSDLHPLEVQTWFRTPNPDLLDEEERKLSPLQWLGMGEDIEAVVDIAERIN
jgi:hypothetical protein